MISDKITLERFIIFLVFIGFVSGSLLGVSIGMYYKSNDIINTIQDEKVFRINEDIYIVEQGNNISSNDNFYRLKLYNCNNYNMPKYIYRSNKT